MSKNYKKTVNSLIVDDIEDKIKANSKPSVDDSEIFKFSKDEEKTKVENKKEEEEDKETVSLVDPKKLFENDFIEVRRNLKKLAKKGQEAVDSCVGTVNEESPAAKVEVLSNLIKSLVLVNKEILTIHESRKKITNPTAGGEGEGQGAGEDDKGTVPMTSAQLAEMVEEAIAPDGSTKK